MATIGSTWANLIDMHKNSTAGTVAEVLAQQNPILDDAMAMQCNLGLKHRHSVRTGLPSTTWGRLYKGVPQSKSTVQQVDDATGFLEAMSSVDQRLLKIAPDPARARLTESGPFIEKMNQDMAQAIFYSDINTTPEQFTGLAPRYNAIGGPGSGTQVIDGGGTGTDNTSIWFVTWGDHATSLLYPQGTKAGIDMEDKGEQRVLDPQGNPYFVKEALYTWHTGLTVKDWRYNARIANIDMSDALAGSVDLWALLRKAYYRLQSRRRNAISSRIAIYMNRDLLEILDAQSSDRALLAANQNYANLTHAAVEGKEVLTYRGFPIRETDALLSTEARVTAYVAPA